MMVGGNLVLIVGVGRLEVFYGAKRIRKPCGLGNQGFVSASYAGIVDQGRRLLLHPVHGTKLWRLARSSKTCCKVCSALDMSDHELHRAVYGFMIESSMTTKQTFGEFLRSVIEAVGIPPSEVASRCGITRRALYYYMNERSRPAEQTLVKLCEVLGLSPKATAAMFVRKRTGRPRLRK
jgi:DNA-binding phage protein